jgi:hypothetical protein
MSATKLLRDAYSRRSAILEANPKSTEKEIFRRLFEMLDCISRIAETPLITLRQGEPTPFSRHSTSERQYRILRMRYEYFITEIYILQERYGAFLKWLHKRYIKCGNDALTGALFIFTSLYKATIDNTFKDIRSQRNVHVHQRLHSDKVIENLYYYKALKFVVGRDKKRFSEMDDYLEFVKEGQKGYYYTVRNIHLKMYKDFSKNQEKALEHIVSRIFSMLYDKNGHFFEPKSFV